MVLWSDWLWSSLQLLIVPSATKEIWDGSRASDGAMIEQRGGVNESGEGEGVSPVLVALGGDLD